METFFVSKESIVRKIWGRGDTVLLIFAGASAEFALNKSVDWLYFTGNLPADPLGRLFSTVRYAQEIVFDEYDAALAAIDKIAAIHKDVELRRGDKIPGIAYLDVLFMLIDYSIRSFELLERRLTEPEKSEIFQVFYRLGSRMGLKAMPDNYRSWQLMRKEYLETNLECSPFSLDLYGKYRDSLGSFRYWMLLHVQVLLVPERVRKLMRLPSFTFLNPIIQIYKGTRYLRMDQFFKNVLLPKNYKEQIAALDML
jgi:uncharacterized protein (DUF2236 family)